jgi:hypothetical protein
MTRTTDFGVLDASDLFIYKSVEQSHQAGMNFLQCMKNELGKESRADYGWDLLILAEWHAEHGGLGHASWSSSRRARAIFWNSSRHQVGKIGAGERIEMEELNNEVLLLSHHIQCLSPWLHENWPCDEARRYGLPLDFDWLQAAGRKKESLSRLRHSLGRCGRHW